jgi:Fur family transcriptional regulator, ferric uptake regulator
VTDDRLDAVIESMRAAGIRMTTPRRVIATALARMGGHVTAHDLATEVQRSYPEVSESTIYRFLERLEEIGLVQHSHLAHGPAVHHLTDEAHAHLLCDTCGEVVEVDRRSFEQLTERITRKYGFVMRPSHFAVEGRCARCA